MITYNPRKSLVVRKGHPDIHADFGMELDDTANILLHLTYGDISIQSAYDQIQRSEHKEMVLALKSVNLEGEKV
tara:strand:+ start:271 stop:492 length:222 start_codon:yes stop_codon:yes gene_type:complete